MVSCFAAQRYRQNQAFRPARCQTEIMHDETYASAAHAFADLVARLPQGRWAESGLGEWDLRSLVGHTSRALITVDAYLDKPADEAVVTSVAQYYVLSSQAASGVDPHAITERGRVAGRALGDDPAAAVRELVDRVLAKLAGADDSIIETIAGGMYTSVYLPTRTFELAVHSRDIARAAGIEAELPEAVVRAAALMATDIAVELGRGAEVLDALTGRVALPADFSVV